MTKETKENIQITSAIAMLIGGFLLAVAGFVVRPPVKSTSRSSASSPSALSMPDPSSGLPSTSKASTPNSAPISTKNSKRNNSLKNNRPLSLSLIHRPLSL